MSFDQPFGCGRRLAASALITHFLLVIVRTSDGRWTLGLWERSPCAWSFFYSRWGALIYLSICSRGWFITLISRRSLWRGLGRRRLFCAFRFIPTSYILLRNYDRPGFECPRRRVELLHHLVGRGDFVSPIGKINVAVRSALFLRHMQRVPQPARLLPAR